MYHHHMKKVALIILDGWGLGELNEHNAIHVARTPFFDHLWENYPHTILQASGEFVGLPAGQIGGSEVGHLTIGAGRVIYQDLPRITKQLQQEAFQLDVFSDFIAHAKKHTTHLIGLVSTGGVHSHEKHLYDILTLMKKNECKSPCIHVIADGRDTAPRCIMQSIDRLQNHINELEYGRITTLCGRFYAMDRDKNWERTNKAVHVVKSKKLKVKSRGVNDLLKYVTQAYERGVGDEFLEPTVVDPEYSGIEKNDVLFFWNYRSDRMKQLVSALHEQFPSNLFYTMTQYDKDYPHNALFAKQRVNDTLGEVLSKLGKKQVRAAETEKYAHVTYFFNGGVEVVFEGEQRALAPSNKVRHDQMPHMQTEQICEQVREQVEARNPEFILVNFANPDMVGHTGVFDAVVAGVEKVDEQLKMLCEFLASHEYICCVTADHGNADIMWDTQANAPHTAHTMNPVPFIIYAPRDLAIQGLRLSQDPSNGLQHIASTVLELMRITPHSAYEKSLIQ